MDFENILPIIILVIYILSVFRKKKAPEKDKPVGKPSGAQKWLNNLVEQLSGEIEPATPEPGPAAPIVVWEKNEDMDLQPPAPKPPIIKEKILKQAVPKKVEAPKEEKPITSTPKKRQSIRAALYRTKLQEKVVWAEILAPPIALREKDHRHV